MSSRFQQAETARKAPLGAVIPKRPVPEASWARREAIINGRKLRRAFSDLFLSCIKEKTSTPPRRLHKLILPAGAPRLAQ